MGLTYKYRTKPYKHQVKALRKLLRNGYGGALLCEPRTGKTKVAIDYASILAKGNKIRKVLVVCPLSVIGVWEEEIAKHCPVKSNIVIWDRDGRKIYNPPRRAKCLNWLLVNYSAFSVPKHRSQMDRMTLRKIIRKWSPGLAILDESHRIKSPGAKKSYAIQSLAWAFDRSKNPKEELIPYRVIMTGTPVTKKKRVFDIYSQWLFLNPYRFDDLGTFDVFKDHFGKWTHRNGYPQWLGNQNIDELRKRIAQDAYMVKREECFDLPPRRNQIIPTPLSDKTQAIYDEMEEVMLAKLANGQITTAQIKLVQALRLAQITSGLAKTEQDKLYVLSSEKLDILRDLLKDLFEADEKVVVAARFRGDHARLRKLGKSLRIDTHMVVGGQSRTERDQHIRDFRQGDGPRLMLVQPQAASLGIDLSTASVMVWYSLTNSYVDFSQTCDRIALSRTETTFLYLIAPDTVDEDIYHTLQDDRDLAKVMLERVKG